MNRSALGMAVLAAACSSIPGSVPTVDQGAIVADVEARVRAYVGSLGPARCADPDPFYAFWTYDHGGVVLAEGGRVVTLDAAAHRAHNKDWFCRVAAQTSTVDTVVVQVLDQNHVISTWTFRESTADTSGVTQNIRGEVMQPWVRRGGTWRSTGLVATHEAIPQEGLPNTR